MSTKPQSAMLHFDRAHSTRRQSGYILLTLLLLMSLFMIASVALAPSIAFQIRRDREEEMIHRGVQYSRAIRLYAKKTGRYPLSMQDLYRTGGTRYLRKLYKDPISGGDFRPLHTADVMSATAPPNLNNSQTQPVDSQNSVGSDGLSDKQNLSSASNQGTEPATTPGSASTSLGNGSTPRAAPDDPTRGVIFGVVSTSKKQTIREFDHKNHYNQWLFFYDTNHDRGYMITGPTQLSLTNTSAVGQPAAGIGQPAAGAGAVQQPSPAQQSAAAAQQ
jgi:type II secretory pathway pseudopilin PulG